MKGGILADDMGLGKTYTMIGLIQQDRDRTLPSLMLVPSVAKNQWVTSVRALTGVEPYVIDHSTRCNIPRGTYLLTICDPSDPRIASGTVYVIASSSILNHNVKSSGLAVIRRATFVRVIIDEGHIIKDDNSLANQTVSSIKTSIRWLMTGR